MFLSSAFRHINSAKPLEVVKIRVVGNFQSFWHQHLVNMALWFRPTNMHRGGYPGAFINSQVPALVKMN